MLRIFSSDTCVAILLPLAAALAARRAEVDLEKRPRRPEAEEEAADGAGDGSP